MVHLILTGATGMVGYGVLGAMLSNTAVTKISILSRRPIESAAAHDKVNVIVHHDYDNYPTELLDQLKGAKGVVWAQGISQTEVNKEEYVRITYDYPLAAAKAFAGLSEDFNFVYVSGEGATQTPGRFTPLFGRVKGESEQALLEVSKTASGALNLYCLRPGGVVPEPEFLKIRQLNLPYRVMLKTLIPLMKTFTPGMLSPTPALGAVLTQLALSDGRPLEGEGISGEGRTISNLAFRRMAGLSA